MPKHHLPTSFSQSSQTPNKRHKPNDHRQPQTSHLQNLSALKKRHRDLTRTLAHKSNLPADVAVSNERELRSLQHDIDAIVAAKERKRQIGRYHMVRFFERQRAERNLKRARRRLKSTLDATVEGGEGRLGGVEDEWMEGERRSVVEDLEKDVKDCEVDLLYTRFFPLVQNYVSLYSKETRTQGGTQIGPKETEEAHFGDEDHVESGDGRDGDVGAQEAGHKRSPEARLPDRPDRSHPVWQLVQQCADEPKQLARLRDGPAEPRGGKGNYKAMTGLDETKRQHSKRHKPTNQHARKGNTSSNEHHGDRIANRDGGNEDDSDGFFET